MKQYTKEQVEKFVQKLWPDVENMDIRVHEDKVEITLSNMYDAPGLNFSKLKAVSDFFETENIDDEDRFSQGGCESCNYGSSYGFTLTVRP